MVHINTDIAKWLKHSPDKREIEDSSSSISTKNAHVAPMWEQGAYTTKDVGSSPTMSTN